jgi:hypothetical protein
MHSIESQMNLVIGANYSYNFNELCCVSLPQKEQFLFPAVGFNFGILYELK